MAVTWQRFRRGRAQQGYQVLGDLKDFGKAHLTTSGPCQVGPESSLVQGRLTAVTASCTR